MIAEKREINPSQLLSLRDRKSLEINGVDDVIRFDEESAVLSTVCGTLTVEGTALHVRVLDPDGGIVAIDGKVYALIFFDPSESPSAEKRGWLGRLFR